MKKFIKAFILIFYLFTVGVFVGWVIGSEESAFIFFTKLVSTIILINFHRDIINLLENWINQS